MIYIRNFLRRSSYVTTNMFPSFSQSVCSREYGNVGQGKLAFSDENDNLDLFLKYFI